MALRLSRRLTVSIPGSSLAAMPAHRVLVGAIRDRDPRAAEAAMRELLRVTAVDIEHVLQQRTA
jgi:DNA-binding FadR family transcriptional regulator